MHVIYTLIITVSFLAFGESHDSARSFRETAPETSLFCSDPIKAVCDRAEERKLKPSYADRESVVKKTLKSSQVSKAVLSDSSHKKWMDTYKTYLTELRNVEKLSLDVVKAEMEEVRGQVRRSVENSVPAPERFEMLKALEPIQIGSRLQFLLDNWNEDNLLYFLNYCGSDGLSQNASFSRSSSTVMFCPVYFTSAMNDEQRFRVLGHEIGHGIDSEKFPETYHLLLSCYKHYYPEYKDVQAGELVSDMWSVSAFTLRNAGKSADEFLDGAAKAYFHYCDTKNPSVLQKPELVTEYDQKLNRGVVVHPEGAFRLGVIFGNDAKVRQMMGCAPANILAPSCSLEGRARRLFGE